MDGATEIACIERQTFMNVSDSFPILYAGLSGDFSARLSQTHQTIGMLKLPLATRVLVILRRLATLAGHKGNPCPVSISSKEIAAFAQAAPESVSRTLTSLEERGIITRGEKGHVVLLINGGLWEED